MLIELAAFTTIFRVVPHRTVQWRHALAGAKFDTGVEERIFGGRAIRADAGDSH